jgi:hypothetical protein
MALYRFFEIDEGNRIRRVQSVRDYPNDEAAILSAKRIIHDRAVEVWERGRLVDRLKPESFRAQLPNGNGNTGRFLKMVQNAAGVAADSTQP